MDEKCWKLATDLRRKAVSTGLNVPLADVLIVACAKRHGAELIHLDKRFPPLLAL